MNVRPPHSRIIPTWLSVALFASALLLAGCVTSTEVREIVRQSNAESVALTGDLLVAEAGSAASLAPADAQGGGSTPDAIARLNAFVESHPENKVTLNALLLRKALLHLNAGTLELARATFEQIDASQLRSARDQGLLAVHDRMLWWWSVARIDQPGVFAANHREDAESAMRALLERAQAAGTPEELRDYLLEMRACIGIKLAADLIDKSVARALIENSVNSYSQGFSPSETAQLASGKLSPSAMPFDGATRRVLRAQTMLGLIATTWRGEPEAFQPRFANEGFKACYAGLLSSPR